MFRVFLHRPITNYVAGSLATMATDTSAYKLNRSLFRMHTLNQY